MIVIIFDAKQTAHTELCRIHLRPSERNYLNVND